jgi:3-methyl-2-oxobutanoate hydroxymethyltransferase
MGRHTVADMRAAHAAGGHFAAVTAWDRPTAEFAEAAGIHFMLVGDSLAQVALGHESTVRVGMSEMLHHTAAVVRSTSTALVIGDMPFLSYVDVPTAAENAARFIRDAGAGAVKLEGGVAVAPIVAALVRSGVPVIGHIGFTPQSSLNESKPRAKGRLPEAAAALLEDAIALQEAGASAIVIELVPQELAAAITSRLTIPTIGIGAGGGCTGQIQVLPDLLGLLGATAPRHAGRIANLREEAIAALTAWRTNVESGDFPTAAQGIAGDATLIAALNELPR